MEANNKTTAVLAVIVFTLAAFCLGCGLGLKAGFKNGLRAANETVVNEWQMDPEKENVHLNDVLNHYDEYFYETERLLDSLDAKYNWQDAFDAEEYRETKIDLLNIQSDYGL